MKNIGGFLGGLVAALGLLVVGAESSHAATLGANKTFTLNSGGFTFLAENKSAPGNGYLFTSSFKPVSELKTGAVNTINGQTIFESLVLNANLDIKAYKYENGAAGNTVVGTLSGGLTVGYNNVAVDLVNDYAAGLSGQASGAGFLLNVNGTVEGQSLAFTAGLDQMFATVNAGDFNGFYDNVINNLGGTFSIVLGNVGNVGYQNPIVNWLGGNAQFAFGNGTSQAYKLSGDISGSYTEVPEPMSAALLGMGLVGGALKRKRRTA